MDSFASWKMNDSGMEKEEREEMPLQGEEAAEVGGGGLPGGEHGCSDGDGVGRVGERGLIGGLREL